MATPRITYNRNAPDPDWQAIRVGGGSNAMFVPETLIKARRAEAREIARQEKGVLFGEYTRSRMGGLTSQSQPPSNKRVTPQILKAIARKSSIDAAIISKIVFTIQRFAKVSHLKDIQLGYRVAHKRERDLSFQPSEEEQKQIDETCRRLEKLISNTTKTEGIYQRLKQFMGAWIEEELTIDRKVMIKRLDSKRRPISYHWLPGADIQPTYRILRPYMEEWGKKDPSMFNPAKAAERLSGRLYKDGKRDLDGNVINLTKAAYVQVLDTDRIVAQWEADEIFVDFTRTYTEIDEVMWGYSPLEQSLSTSLLWIQATDYQQQTLNVEWPEAIMVLHGDYDQEGLEAFKQSVLADKGNGQRLPVIAAGAQQDGATAEMLQLRQTNTEMQFQDLLNWIIKHKCGFYGLRPITLDTDSSNVDPTAQQELNYTIPEANDPGIRGRMEGIAEIITEQIIEPWESEYEMVWCGLDNVPEDARIQRELGQQSYKTFNETRSSVGLKALPKEMPETIGDWVPNPQYIAAMEQIMASQQQEQAGAPQNPSQLSQPSGSGGSGDFGNGDAMPGSDGPDPTQPVQGAQPPQPTQPTPPPQPIQPVEGARK